MSGKVFLDTNILVYLYSEDEIEKRAVSTRLTEQYRCLTSVQTLNEFCNVLLKKMKKDRQEVEEAVTAIVDSCVTKHVEIETLRYAIALHARYGYSYYDSVMLASALENGCKIFYSEDLSDGQTIDSRLLIVNPFTQ
ncbi:MAG: PIN domain-containing protein [Oscillospiraceae bacterium]|nr:PIN domain-containing protein [Oscillospiraceae bacterium]